MTNFVRLRTALASTILLLVLPLVMANRPVAANYQSDDADADDITGGWTWEWTNAPDYTKAQCPGGNGKITITHENGKRTIAFRGEPRNADGSKGETIEKSGSWEYLGKDPKRYNRRKYRFNWSNGSDTVVLSDSGNTLRGDNGQGCLVTGSR